MDLTALRENYPALHQQTYLNTASCGILSRSTAQTAQDFYHELLEQGGTPRNAWYEQIPALRQEIATWLGAQPDELTLLPNFSIANNYVARALSAHRRVLLLDSDYSSLTMPWLLHGYQVHYFSADANGFFDLERIKKEIEENDINVLAISHVQYTTGLCVDLAGLGRWCRSRKVVLVVDATQSLGVMPIDVDMMQVDILMGSGYKWMTAGFGNALLYVHRSLHDQLTVAAVGNNSFDGFPRITSAQEITYSARVLETGHYDFSSFFALRQAVRDLQSISSATIAQRVAALTAYLHRQLPNAVRIVSDYPAAHRSGITVIEGDITLERKLLKHQVITSARAHGLRISLHFYNTEADVDRLCEVL